MKIKRILITGICGFLGNTLARRLNWDKPSVITGVDNLSNGKIENLYIAAQDKEIKLIVSDFSSDLVLELVSSGYFSHVFHLAAQASVPYSVDHLIETNDTNITKTLHLLDACVEGKVEKFIFSSSSAVYGNTTILPTHEVIAKNPMSPYAVQKSTIEEYCSVYRELHGLNTVCLRYFNIYGPRQNGFGAYANVISSWATNCVLGKPIRLDGDGSFSRDFIHVDDVADANITAGFNKKTNGIYNIGTGKNVTIKQILEIFKKEFPDLVLENAPTRQGDVKATLADITRAQNEFGFDARISDVLTALPNTIQWYKDMVKKI